MCEKYAHSENTQEKLGGRRLLLYIVRHGDPDYATDSLTERGILQAEAVGKRIAASKIDRIFSSPMGRAKQTAEPACRLLGRE